MNYGKQKPVEIFVYTKKDGSDEWEKSINVSNGDEITIRISLKNRTKYFINNVIVRDCLPDGLCYVDGSTMIIDNRHPLNFMATGGLSSIGGYNIGELKPGVSICLYLRTRVDCERQTICNVARVSADFPNSLNESSAYIIVN